MERLGLQENDRVGIEVRKLRVTPELTPEVDAALRFVFARYAADLDFLADK